MTSLIRLAAVPVVIALTMLGASGCSTPGLSIEEYGGSAPWFGGDDPRTLGDEDSPNYQPELHQIDSELVLEMQNDPAEHAASYELPSTSPQAEYEIGPGDLLSVIVFGHPELTNPTGTTESVSGTGQLVDSNGNIFFPFAGDMRVAGRTVAEVRDMLTNELSRVLQSPQVDVRVLEFRSRQAFVVGDIQSPCVVPITDQPQTILQVLTVCQATSGSGSGGGAAGEGITAGLVKLQRDGRNYNIPLTDLYLDRERQVFVQAGDRIVIDDRFSRVFLVGEFEEQLAVPISVGGLTLADAMVAAGGLSLDTANSEAIYVIRDFVEEVPGADPEIRTAIRPQIYKLNAGSVTKLVLADQFPLQPRDVVFAAPASIVNFNRALAQITPTLNLLFQSFLIFDRAGS